MPNWIRNVVLLVFGIVFVLGSILYLGRVTQQDLRDHERYLGEFSSIECQPPGGMKRIDFLDEVQYYSQFPNDLSLLDENTPGLIAEAFAKHPWVEKVDKVEISQSQTVRVRLSYRKPVLAVRWRGRLLAVDRHGILLPRNALTHGLPLYSGNPTPPQGPAGTDWGDPEITQAAKAVGR
ncbi:MAG: hypothetical protein ACFCD0_05685 [Gemmataceae bacterium]